MKKIIFLFLVISILASITFAQENMGARPIGMGGAFTGLADDVNAIFVNPAGIGYVRGEMALVSTKIVEGKEYTLIGGVEHTAFGSFGVGYVGSSFPLNSLSGTASIDDGNTPVKALNQTLVLSYARELNEFMVVPKSMGRLSIGTSLKFISARTNNAKGLSSIQGSGINADFAAVFRPNDNLSLGVNVKNLFEKDDQLNEAQIFDVAAGVSGNVFDKSLIWSVEGGSLGIEWKPISELALRVGKDGNYNTAGFGINLDGLGVEYGYMEKEEPIHYLAVSVTIDRSKTNSDLRQASLNIE